MKIVRYCVLSVMLMALQTHASTLPENIEHFKSALDLDRSEAVIDIREIQTDFPASLLSAESLLPQTDNYPLVDLQKVYQISQNCKGKLPLSPTVTNPLVFSRALCRGTKLPVKWFVRSGFIHPGGGTYAARYVEEHPEAYQELEPFMHIKERPLSEDDSLLSRLQAMDYDAVQALISNSETIITNDELWLKVGALYYVFSETYWHSKLGDFDLNALTLLETEQCYVRSGNVCWNIKTNSNLLLYSVLILVLINIGLVISWGYSRWISKRKEMRSRMLVLQILTHELRTPIASLSLTVEGFRREFEALPESVYSEFRRLCEDTRRLRQLAEASKDYLQSDKQRLATEWIPSISEWLEYRYQYGEFEIEVQLNKDVSAKLNLYWLGTCIDNLVRNACKYGVDPVRLEVTVYEDKIEFEVIDQGQLTAKDWSTVKQPFFSKSGLGLGLTIVESMVGRMGGRMTLNGPPTAFKLEIPCETDVATR